MQKIYGFVFITALLFSSSAFTQTKKWDINDVSILFPLPAKNQPDFLLPIENLIPEKILTEFPRLSIRYDDKKIFQALRVLALRIDPIQRQIKLVWQPILPGPGQQMMALDAALHAFYQLSEQDFKILLDQLQLFKNRVPYRPASIPLQIHPAFMSDQRIENLKLITDLIRQYASTQNLVKITAMVLRGGDDMWAFIGFDMTPAGLAPIKIPFTGNSTAQLFINQAIPFTSFNNFDISPLAKNTADPFTDSFLGASMKLRNQVTLTEAEVLQTVRTAYMFENPRLTPVDDLDCVSCHVSQPLRQWLLPQISETLFDTEYKNPNFNLTSTHIDPINTRRIRGFGYFGTEPAISERVINESAEVAENLNQQSHQQKGRK